MSIKTFLRLLRGSTARREQDLDAEIRAHMEMAVQERIARGESRADAERAVRREFGNEARVKEVTRTQWQGVLGGWADRLRQDLRFGVRSLMRDPRYSLAAILTLGLGLGAAVTVFSMVETILLRPLPYVQPDRLVVLETYVMSTDELDGSSVPNVEDWGAMSGSIEEITYFRRPRVSQVTIRGEFPQREQEGLVGAGFFGLVGSSPSAGRTFTREEVVAGRAVTVLRQDLWEELFGAEEFRTGETVSVAGNVHEIVGVMPPDFGLPTRDTRLWRPLAATEWWRLWSTDRRSDGVMALARLRDGVELEEARAELGSVASSLRQEYAVNADKDIRVDPLSTYFRAEEDTRAGLWLLLTAVVLLLSIACANVAGLTAARGTSRRREMGLRSAIGARRVALLRQLVVESLVVATAATVLGLAVSYFALEMLALYGPADLPRVEQVSLSPVAVGFASLAALFTTALVGALPALGMSHVFPASVLHSHRATGRQRSGKRATDDLLVAAQVAIAAVLLVGGGLLLESFLRARSVDPGFEPQRLAIVALELPEATYPGDAEQASFYRLAQQRLQELPEVESTGAITGFFVEQTGGTDPRSQAGALRGRSGGLTAPEGWTTEGGEMPPRAEGHGVTVGYLEAVGIPLLHGRYLDEGDLELTPPDSTERGRREAIVISKSMADAYWPGRDAIGRGVQLGRETFAPDDFAYQVVGVVADVRREGLDVAPRPAFYIGDVAERMDLSIRTTGAAAPVIPAIRSVLRDIDPALPVTIRTAEDVFRERLSRRRFQTALLFGFAIVALLLSGTGVYALVSYHVAGRTREIGLRGALGASRASMVALVMRRCGGPVAVGLAAGLAVAAALARSFRSILFEVQPLDPLVYVATTLVLLSAALAAAYFPARRATRIDPLEALRTEP